MNLIKKILGFFKKDCNNTLNPFKFSLKNTENLDNFKYETPEELNLNPKFNRTTHEKSLINNFCLKYNSKIEQIETNFYNSNSKIYKINDVNLRIRQYEVSIEILNNFKKFCSSKGIGGKLYFEDMWEHCHNSKNPDFKFIDKLYEELRDLKNNKNFYINKNKELEEINEFKKVVNQQLLDIISKNQGILQKDVYKHFKSYFKSSIQSSLYFMAKNKLITREKYKNTYKLYKK